MAVCIIGGAFFGASITLGLAAIANYPANTAGDVHWLNDVVNAATILLIGTTWGLLFAIPVGIPAGAIAAGFIWWLRGASWQPRTRATWSLMGCLSGITLAALIAIPLSALAGLGLQVILVVVAGTGAACGALLGWLVSPQFIAVRR
jgi:hypothetical protein